MMGSNWRALVAFVLAAIVVAACSGGHSGTSSLPQTQNPVSSTSTTSGTLSWGQKFIAQLSYTGPVTSPMGLSIVVGVRMQNAAGLMAYAQSANDPASANYHHWLTPTQIGEMYGASVSDYEAAANYLKSFGLQVGGWPQREVLSVSGSTAQFAKAFGTTFGMYTFLGKQVVAASSSAHVPSTVPITWAPLFNAPVERTYLIKNNNAAYYGYAPQQIATGFDYSGAYSTGYNGSGVTIGVIGTGPILASDGKSDDLVALHTYWRASIGSLVQVNASPQPATVVNGFTGTGSVDYNPTNLSAAPAVTNPNANYCNNPTVIAGTPIPNYVLCNPEDAEAQIDTQSQASLAPGATVLFYMAYNSNEFCIDNSGSNAGGIDPIPPTGPTCPSGETPYPFEGIDLVDDEIQQAIADNRADALSMSFGEPENDAVYDGYIYPSGSGLYGVGQIEMASLASEGIAVFVSSGDNGAWECFDPTSGTPLGTACVSYPASDPNVTAVGGVNIPLDESGNLTGAITAWADNTTLGGNGLFENNVGSGGGVSSVFAAPAWQVATLGASMRTIPDMSLEADPNTGPSIFVDFDYGYPPSAWGGTSVAAPEAAALWALVLQACKAVTCSSGGYRLGNPASALYAIYAKSNPLSGSYTPAGFTPQLGYSQVFYDITYGDNQAAPATPGPAQTPTGYNAGPGYDEVTGIGAPFGGHLIQAVTGTQVP